jgi:hypothetical protein
VSLFIEGRKRLGERGASLLAVVVVADARGVRWLGA